MECSECFQNFDEKLRRPKALPCGHTFCLECLQNVEQCFLDRKSFEGIPLDLPDCQNVLTLMRSSVSTSNSAIILHVWCMECEKGAIDRCVDEGHQLKSTESLWIQQALKKLSRSEQELNVGHINEIFDKLDEEGKAEVKQIMAGQVAPVDILLAEGDQRWCASLDSGCTSNEGSVNILHYLLPLLRAQDIIPKELLLPVPLPDTSVDDSITDDDDTELNLTNISICKNQASIAEEKLALLASDGFLKKRRLKGLYCYKDRKWCLKVLQCLAPCLEEAHLFNVHLEHLEAVQRMPQLRWLVLEDLLDDMGKNKDYELPQLHHKSKVEFLWTNFQRHHYNYRLCKALIKSHQESVCILFTSLPSYHTDAIEFFDGIDFKNLHTLMYASNHYCSSDNCYRIMIGLRKRFPDKKLMCFRCGRTESFDN